MNLLMGEMHLSQIAELRKKKKLTQRQLADSVGVDPSTIRNWERHRAGVDIFVKVAKLCAVLDCQPADLFKPEETPDE